MARRKTENERPIQIYLPRELANRVQATQEQLGRTWNYSIAAGLELWLAQREAAGQYVAPYTPQQFVPGSHEQPDARQQLVRAVYGDVPKDTVSRAALYRVAREKIEQLQQAQAAVPHG